MEWGWNVWNLVFKRKRYCLECILKTLQRFHRTSTCEVFMLPMTLNVSENNIADVRKLHKKSMSYLSTGLSYHQKNSFIKWIRPGVAVLMERI